MPLFFQAISTKGDDLLFSHDSSIYINLKAQCGHGVKFIHLKSIFTKI